MQSWTHLGHIDDENDIARSRHNLIGKLNDVLSTFREIDSFVKVHLLKNYCLSLYGCELMGRLPCLSREYLQVLAICVEECMGITEYVLI